MGFKNNDRCLNNPNLGDDEPIFVLRARDRSAPDTARHWLDAQTNLTPEHRAETERCIAEMERWQEANAGRVKAAD